MSDADERLLRVLRRLTAPLAALALATVALAGCSESIPPPDADPAPSPTVTPSEVADDAPPASAVLPYVPASTAVLTVTDYRQVAAQLGVELSSSLSPAERASFWQRATTETAVLSPGLLRSVEGELLSRFRFGAEDVAWEAHFVDADGTETGTALGFREGTDLGEVQKAIDGRVGPLTGGQLVDGGVVVVGPLPDVADSWAADPTLAGLVGPEANSVYVQRGCVPAAPGTPRLQELTAYSLTFEGGLATARLGTGRDDLFTRLHLGDGDPQFRRAFAQGVADPLTGRIGYELTDPVGGADLALRQELPFASCQG